MAILIMAASIVFGLLAWSTFSFIANYVQARRIGLPILISPVNPMNPVWVLFNKQLVPYLNLLPFGLGTFATYSTLGWSFQHKYHLHAKHGDVFVIVNPGKNVVTVADASAVDEITSRRKDFQKAAEMYKALEIFGPNVDTVEGETWQRHRRLTTPPFNERNSNFVWRESLTQAKGMLHSWLTNSKDGVPMSDQDTMVLALHVLTAAGFGKSYEFAGGLQNPAKGHSMTYKDALRIILANILITIITSSINLPSWLLPRRAVEVAEAKDNFKRYMVEMVEEERTAIAEKAEESDNLMSVLIRASESSQGGEKGRNGLTDDEIYGNLFIYNLAGHETTANTLAYAVALLATNTKCQDWIGEELDAVFGPETTTDAWQYEKAFPQLQRCLALMYETLRLYGPVIFIPKYTNESPQRLVLSGKECTIPAHTYVYIDSIALHTMPQHWGSDSLVWRPQRWINAQDEMHQPAPGTFVPWAAGPRVCPGKKFSQVEFVAVIACLLRRHRVEPVAERGETPAEANKRTLRLVEDSELEVTMKMKEPKRIRLRWFERSQVKA